MNVNPLDIPGTPFEVELLNPNPSSSRKGYRISFQVSEEVHSAFMAAREGNLRLVGYLSVLPDTDEEVVNGMDKQTKTQPKPKAAKEPTPYGQLWKQLHLSGFFAAPGVRETLGEVSTLTGEPPHQLMRKVFGVESLSAAIGPDEIFAKWPPNEYPAVKTMVEQALRKVEGK